MNTKKITRLGLLIACGLILFIIENLFPPVLWFAPYVRLGLSNIAVLFVLLTMGEWECMTVAVVKCVLGCAVTGTWYAFAFNIAGGVGGAMTMILLYRFVCPKVGVVTLSSAAAVVSNILRTVVGAVVMQTGGLLLQLPVAAAMGVLAGMLVGFACVLLVKKLPPKLLG